MFIQSGRLMYNVIRYGCRQSEEERSKFEDWHMAKWPCVRYIYVYICAQGRLIEQYYYSSIYFQGVYNDCEARLDPSIWGPAQLK